MKFYRYVDYIVNYNIVKFQILNFIIYWDIKIFFCSNNFKIDINVNPNRINIFYKFQID